MLSIMATNQRTSWESLAYFPRACCLFRTTCVLIAQGMLLVSALELASQINGAAVAVAAGEWDAFKGALAGHMPLQQKGLMG